MEDEKKVDSENGKADNTASPEDNETDNSKDNRSLGEKIEDGMDEVVANVQDFFYGEKGDSTHDIPATIMDPDNEIRHINKVQTRRNFNKRYGFKILKWFFLSVPILIGVVILAVIIKLLIG